MRTMVVPVMIMGRTTAKDLRVFDFGAKGV